MNTIDERRNAVRVVAADLAAAAETLVIVPAFREAAVIGGVVAGLRAAGWQVVVIDDGSPDATGAVARNAGAWVLQHPVNVGQGAALRTGFAFALSRPEIRFIVTFDADGQHDGGALPRLLEPLRHGEADVALGSRFLGAGGPPATVPFARRVLLAAATRMARWSTGLQLTDTHNGMRAFRREALAQLVLAQDRMAHASEILAQIAHHRLRYREVPVRVQYTAYSLAKGQRMVDAISILWDLLFAKAR